MFGKTIIVTATTGGLYIAKTLIKETVRCTAFIVAELAIIGMLSNHLKKEETE